MSNNDIIDIIKNLISKSNNLSDLYNLFINDYNLINLLCEKFKVYDFSLKTDNIGNYYRNTVYLDKDNLFEIIIIQWDKLTETKIHNHSLNGCILIPINNNLIEYIYNKKLELISENQINKISYIDNNIGYHKIKSIEKSLSIHIYSPPNHIPTIYND